MASSPGFASCRRWHAAGFRLLLFLWMLLLQPAATTRTTVNRVQYDNYKDDDKTTSPPLVLECREGASIQGPSCSFRLQHPGHDTFQVCTTTTSNKNSEDTPKGECWQVTLSIQKPPLDTATNKDPPERLKPLDEWDKSSIHNQQQERRKTSDPPEIVTSVPLPTEARNARKPDPPPSQPKGAKEVLKKPDPPEAQNLAQQALPNHPKEERLIRQQKQQPQQQPPYNRPIQIGMYTYRPPFGNFGKDIQYLLQRPRYDDVAEEARWLQSIGVAFQQRANLQYSVSGYQATVHDLVQRAAAAFQEALMRYKNAMADPSPRTTGLSHQELQLQEAMVYMELATAQQLSLSQPQNVAIEYLTRAEATLRSLYEQTVTTQRGNAQFGVELVTAYAEACLRLGVALSQGADENNGEAMRVATSGVAGQAEEWFVLQAGDNYESLLQNPAKIEKMMRDYIPPLVAKSHKVIRLFIRSKTLWWNMLMGENSVRNRLSLMDARHALQHLATTSQNLGNSWLALEQYELAVLALEEAWQIQEEMVWPTTKGMSDRNERDATVVAMGENLYALADVYLRMGDYKKATDRYKQAMDWFHEHKIARPATVLPDDVEADENHGLMIQTYEQALEEYHSMFKDGVDSSDPVVSDSNGFYRSGDADFGDQEFYERNDGYEGDLHNTLGALYLNAGDIDQAALHLQQALRLYLNAGEGQDATTASTHTQLAALYFQQGEYKSSAEQHRLASEIYQKILTPGENPLLQGGVPIVQWPELLAEALRDLPDVSADLPATLDINALIEEKPASQMRQGPAETQAEKVEVKRAQPKDPPGRQAAKDMPKETIAHKIHIDLDAFSQAQANETKSGSDEL